MPRIAPSPRSLLAAASVTLALATPAAAETTLINVFQVPQGKETQAIAAWEAARDFLARQPGYRSTVLHQAITPDARFQLINVAKWESPEHFAKAAAAMREAKVFPPIEGLSFDAALYRPIREDGGAPGL